MKLKYLFIFSLLTLLFASCNNKKNNQSEIDTPILRPAEMTTNAQDTAEVTNLVNQYMALFAKGDLDGASSLLYHVKNDSVHPYTEQERQDYKNHLSIFSVVDYKISTLKFDSEKNNEVGVTIQITPDGDLNLRKGTMDFSFNPVKIDNHWYLTLMDLQAEGVRRYYDK